MSKDLEKEFELVVDKIERSVELISDDECVELKLEALAEDFEHKKSTKPAWIEFLGPFLDTFDFNFFINNRQKYIDRVKDQDQKIADLEAKLAESEERLKLSDCIINQYADKDKNYAQQLEEKDKEISNLNGLVRERDKQIKNLKTNKKRVIEHKNKNKISFTIEKLEKVKEKILSYEEIYYQFLESGAKVPVVCIENFRVKQTIDNQINELKGEK